MPADGTLITPLSNSRIHITDVQKHRVIGRFDESNEKRPLQREQFETLYHQIQTAHDGFDLDRLPLDADPYPAVLSVHPRFEIDEDAGVIAETDGPTTIQLADTAHELDIDDDDRTEPDGLDIYSDALLLIDALERHDVTDLPDLETATLVNLYTLLSDVQRDANDFRQEVADVLLSRLHHDRPVAGQYGSVQRTSRRNRSLRDDEEVLSMLEAEGIDRERVMSVDRQKVDEALEMTTLTESDVYEIDESEYVRNAEVDDDVKESRLQGLKDRLDASEETEAEELQQEIEALEERIDDLTSFRAGTEVQE
ncbi:hypothetical protein ACFR99_19950 [Haloarchaeobius amylolyticus]|uniref:DUF2800 domain-containing protein n=1 Tax=Haloarchaeobius amylolyticus TaxID=1198296 RepID=A0ABD6BLI9_9EURY